MRLELPVPADILEAIRAPFLAAPATLLDAPILQPLGLMLDLAGETLRERLFVVQGDGPEACLRPDFTIPALLAHLVTGAGSGRYVYSGNAFQVAARGVDRAEEFRQIGVEAFEPGDGAEADAEMAALAWRAASAGGRDDLTLLMGDVALFGDFVDALAVAPPLATRQNEPSPRPDVWGRNSPPPPTEPGRPPPGASLPCCRAFPKSTPPVFWKRSGLSPASSRWAVGPPARSSTA